MAYYGINFRASSAYVTDGTGETYSLGEAYPTTRGGLTFGWSANRTGTARDRGNSGYDRRLAGTVFSANSTPTDFRIDLPSTGTAQIRLAIGDLASSQLNRLQLLDGATVFATLSGDTTSTQFIDATGVIRTDVQWPANNVALSHTFTTTTFIVRVGDGVTSANSAIAHASFDITGAAPDSTASGATLTATATISPGSASGSSPGVALGANIVSITSLSAGSASAQNAGTLTTKPLKNNTGTVLASETGVTINVYHQTTGALIVQKTGLTTDAAGVATVTDTLIVPGTTYAYEPVLSGARRRLPMKAAA